MSAVHLLAVAASALALSGCATVYTYPTANENAMVGMCMATGGTESRCKCVLRWYENNVPFAELAAEEAGILRTKQPSANSYSAVAACR
jgi:hypothetical protein